MIKLFLGNKTYVLLLIPFFLVCYQMLNYYFEFVELVPNQHFGLWLENIELNAIIAVVLASLVVLLNSFGLNLLVNRNNFYERNTYLVALIYVVFMSLFECSYFLNSTLLLHSTIIFMIHQLFELNKREDGRKNIFNAFLFFAIGVTLCPIYIFLLPMLIVSVTVIRQLSFKEFLMAFSGFSIPFIYYFSITYLNGSVWRPSLWSSHFEIPQKDFWFVTISLIVFLVLSLFSVVFKMRQAKIQTNKQIRSLIILILFFFLLSLYELISFQQIDHFSLLIIPMSVLLIFAFLSDTYGMAANVLFYVVIVYSVIKFFLFLPSQAV